MSGSYAFGLAKNCPSASSCSGHDASFGIELRYHALPDDRIDPWFGIGAGYQWFSSSNTIGGTTLDANADGVEFVHAQLGADLLTSRNVHVGPFIQFSLGQYRLGAVHLPRSRPGRGIAEKGLQEVLQWR